MSGPEPRTHEEFPLDDAWLNDRSEFQMSFVHGLKNPTGLHIQYELVDREVRGRWTPDQVHVGFPGFVHGGLLAAVLDDVLGRYAALLHRWAVTARFDVRYRVPAPLGEELTIVGAADRVQQRSYQAHARLELADGTVVAEGSGLYLTIRDEMAAATVRAWPGFEAYLPTRGAARHAEESG